MVSKKRRAEKLTNCWNGSDNFAKLQLVKNRRFPGSIKTNHENSHLFLAKKTREKFSEHTSHDESLSTGENTDFKISSTSTAKNDLARQRGSTENPSSTDGMCEEVYNNDVNVVFVRDKSRVTIFTDKSAFYQGGRCLGTCISFATRFIVLTCRLCKISTGSDFRDSFVTHHCRMLYNPLISVTLTFAI